MSLASIGCGDFDGLGVIDGLGVAARTGTANTDSDVTNATDQATARSARRRAAQRGAVTGVHGVCRWDGGVVELTGHVYMM